MSASNRENQLRVLREQQRELEQRVERLTREMARDEGARTALANNAYEQLRLHADELHRTSQGLDRYEAFLCAMEQHPGLIRLAMAADAWRAEA